MLVVLCWAGMPGPMFWNLFLNMPIACLETEEHLGCAVMPRCFWSVPIKWCVLWGSRSEHCCLAPLLNGS